MERATQVLEPSRARAQRRTLAVAALLSVAMLAACLAAAHAQGTGARAAATEATTRTFLQAAEITAAAWRAWMRTYSPYAVALVGGMAAYFTGFVIFLIAYFVGMFAPTAARVGLWFFSVLWFLVLAAVFMPLTAPLWWWLAGLGALFTLLLLVPRPRTVA